MNETKRVPIQPTLRELCERSQAELERRFDHHFSLAMTYANQLETKAAEEPAAYGASPVTESAAVPQAGILPSGGEPGAPETLIGKAQRVTRKMLDKDRRRARREGAA